MTPVYLVVVQVSGDADRKRLEYIVEKHRRLHGPGSIEKLCSGVLLVKLEPGGARSFLEELYARFGSHAVRAWRLEEPGRASPEPVVYEETLRVGAGDVWPIIGYIMAKHRGALVSESMDGSVRVYRARTRHGIVEARFELARGGSGPGRLRVTVTGYGQGVAQFFRRLLEDLRFISV